MFDSLISTMRSAAAATPAAANYVWETTKGYGSAAGNAVYKGIHKVASSESGKIAVDKTMNVVKSKPFIVGVGAAAGTVGAVTLAPTAAGVIGFAAGGIKMGSVAASMMSTLGGGATAPGSLVAVLQSVGATGTVLGSVAATGTSVATGAAAGAAVASKLCKSKL